MKKVERIIDSMKIQGKSLDTLELGIELYSFGEFKGAYSSKHHDPKISEFFNDLLDKIINAGDSSEVIAASIRQFLIDTTASDNWTVAIFVRGENLFAYIGEYGNYQGYICFEVDEDFVYFDVDDDDDEDWDWNNDDDDVEED